jgi:hypothetical protein
MRVIVTNATGSQKREASLSKEGGVVTFDCGEVSHLQFLLSLNHSIKVKKDEEPEKVAEKEVAQSAPSSEQSKKGKKASSK